MKLYKYQEVGRDYLARNDRALLADDPGLGKTAQTLKALVSGARVLIVCPLIAKGVWKKEASMWVPDFSFYDIKNKKLFRWPVANEICTVTYDNLPSKIPIDVPTGLVVVLEECHIVKNQKAKRTKKVRELCALTRLISGNRVWGLSGTPILSSPADLWNVLEAIGLSKRMYKNKKTFVSMHGGELVHRFMGLQSFYVYEWGGKISPEAKRIFNKYCLRRKKEDVLADLPDKIYDNIILPLDYDKDKACKNFEELLKSSNITIGDLECKISESSYFKDIDISELAKARSLLATSKIPAMVEYIEDMEEQGTPLVVFSAHRAPIDALKDRPGWCVITGNTCETDRVSIVNRFQNGELKGVGATIRAAGIALTLTKASRCLFVDREWTPALNRQAEDRLHRVGQKNSVQISTLVYNHPIELRVYDVLLRKQQYEKGVLE